MFRFLTLPSHVRGRVLLHTMPGRFEPWPLFLDTAHHQAVSEVVCLNPMDEVQTLSPSYHQAIEAGTLPFRWRHVPMRDFGVGHDPRQFCEAIDAIAERLAEGDHVLLHCAAGIGRTGSAAACVLKRLGLTVEHALEAVQRAGSNPQSAAQTGLIQLF